MDSLSALSPEHQAVVSWLLACDEPWTAYRARIDLMDRPSDEPAVLEARASLVTDPRIRELISHARTWGGKPLKRHNDASHPFTTLGVLADFGLTRADPGIDAIWQSISAHVSDEDFFESLLNIPERFGGSGEDEWAWIACDAYALLYPLLAFGYGAEPTVSRAVAALVKRSSDVGWRCAAASRFGSFKGPGKREHPCPIATVHGLKALSQVNEAVDSPAARAGVEMLLHHWDVQGNQKYFLFGIGTDFRKPKYPMLWYDIVHVVDVLSRFPLALRDARFRRMADELLGQLDEDGRVTARSMYRAWKGWSFADKKHPSPWLTLLAHRIARRFAAANV